MEEKRLSTYLKVEEVVVSFGLQWLLRFVQLGLKGGLCTSSFHGSWGTSTVSEDYAALARSVRLMPIMKNVNK